MKKPVPDPLLGWVGVALVDDIREMEWIEHRIVGAAENLIHPRQIQAKSGQASPRHPKEHLTEQLSVEILAKVSTLQEVDALLAGWRGAMDQPDSLRWLR